ncbi:probable WRKY transcription factor 19 [Cynara cardunculus var. scolymus]|uniref:probable WRKY transcription factor 19 n=1 Tax=Cynara cardunculus var. scolymus TaxID=59895 RepID=UPI000D62CE5B|nr:probable WRKY transcription factor 19 [Cynara cardunculus var. scolymus]
MHDLIQEMGWKIVRQSLSNSRLWELEEIRDVLERNRKLKNIEAIVLPAKRFSLHDYEPYDRERLGFSDEVFRRMENLRFLVVDHLRWQCISREPTFLPHKLRWLCWHHYPFSSLPVEHMRKLVGLEMFDGMIKHLWKGPKVLPNMKFIDLGYMGHLTSFPDVSAAPNIERLILSDCHNLVEVHPSLGFHRRLVYLDMSRCTKLKCLPFTIGMESLETLIFSGCFSLERFPEVTPSMVKLSELYLNNCIRVEELPSSIRYLSGLRVLNLIGWSKAPPTPQLRETGKITRGAWKHGKLRRAFTRIT